METRTSNTTESSKCIINPAVAKRLVRAGNQIIDLKANKRNPDRTVFVFKADDKFCEDLKKISDQRKEDYKSKTKMELEDEAEEFSSIECDGIPEISIGERRGVFVDKGCTLRESEMYG